MSINKKYKPQTLHSTVHSKPESGSMKCVKLILPLLILTISSLKSCEIKITNCKLDPHSLNRPLSKYRLNKFINMRTPDPCYGDFIGETLNDSIIRDSNLLYNKQMFKNIKSVHLPKSKKGEQRQYY